MFELITQNLFYLTLTAIIGLGLTVLLVVLIRDVFRNNAGTGWISIAGLILLFLGERWIGEGTSRTVASGLGTLIVLGSVGLRVVAMGAAKDERRRAHQQGLVLTSLLLGGLVLYGLTLPTVTDAFGLGDDALARWNGVFQSTSPILVLAGILPIVMIDRVLGAHPIALPTGVVGRAVASGLSSALAISLVVPVNYLADHYDKSWDLAYFRTTKAGESTQNIVGSLAEPVTITLFYPPGSEVRRELEPYFQTLVDASSGQIELRMVDQALDPELSEKLQIRDNGYVALTQGDHTEKFKVEDDIDRAKRDLKKLDQTVRKNLIKLTRGQRTVYWLVGHGEASHKEREDPLRKLSVLKRQLFDPLNLKLTEFGVTNGSAEAVPDDAALLVIAAPKTQLLPEEITAIKAYIDDGGRLLVLNDAEGDPLNEIVDHLGVETGQGTLAHMSKFLPRKRGPEDRVNLATNKYGSHEAVKNLSRTATQYPLIIPSTRWVQKKAGSKTKVSTLLRSFPETFEDLNGNYEQDEDEEAKVYEMAVAVTAEPKAEGEQGLAAIVVGDVQLYSDALLQQSQANALFAGDSLVWLLDDPDLAGDVESEEDVQIVHTNEEDAVWFAMTVLGVPLLVLAFGIILVRLRKRE